MPEWFINLILGVVEGITEFIPVSSTGHLLVAERLLHVEKSDLYNIVIQCGAVLAVLMLGQLGWALARTAGLGRGSDRPGVSSVAELGRVLFTDYMFAFEVTSILIIAAMVGAVVLARKREE